MRKFILVIFLISTPAIFSTESDILREIKNLRVDMNQMRDDMNQMRDDMNKRFEQIDKRFDFIQNLITVIIGLIFTSPFLVEYMARKRSEKERDVSDKTEKLIIALKEVAQKDTRLAKALKLTGLL
jgi:uncharacterized protein YoxC